LRKGTLLYWGLFFFLCLDFGGVGFNNFIGAVIVAVYVIPVVFCLIILALPDEDEKNKKKSAQKSSYNYWNELKAKEKARKKQEKINRKKDKKEQKKLKKEQRKMRRRKPPRPPKPPKPPKDKKPKREPKVRKEKKVKPPNREVNLNRKEERECRLREKELEIENRKLELEAKKIEQEQKKIEQKAQKLANKEKKIELKKKRKRDRIELKYEKRRQKIQFKETCKVQKIEIKAKKKKYKRLRKINQLKNVVVVKLKYLKYSFITLPKNCIKKCVNIIVEERKIMNNMFKTTINTSATLNNDDGYNFNDKEFLQEQYDSALSEIIQFFSERKHACTPKDNRERFVFHKLELDYILSKLINPEWIKVGIEYDDVDENEVYCYVLDFTKEIVAEENKAKRQKTKRCTG